MQNISLFCIKVDSCSSSWLNGVSYDFQNEFKWNRTRDESGGWSIDASREARWSHHGMLLYSSLNTAKLIVR